MWRSEGIGSDGRLGFISSLIQSGGAPKSTTLSKQDKDRSGQIEFSTTSTTQTVASATRSIQVQIYLAPSCFNCFQTWQAPNFLERVRGAGSRDQQKLGQYDVRGRRITNESR